MKLTPLGIAAAAALGLAACSGSDDAPKTDASADTASETAATAPATSMPSDPAVPVDGAPLPADPEGAQVTPPTLPTDPTMEPTSQATASPPPQ